MAERNLADIVWDTLTEADRERLRGYSTQGVSDWLLSSRLGSDEECDNAALALKVKLQFDATTST